jgi:hypothetical protein
MMTEVRQSCDTQDAKAYIDNSGLLRAHAEERGDVQLTMAIDGPPNIVAAASEPLQL